MPDLFTIEHGAGGLWHRHQWNEDVTLNIQDPVDEDDVRVREQIVVNKITGLHSLGQRQDANSQRMGRIGDNHRRTSQRGKPVVYDCTLIAGSVLSGHVLRSATIAGFAYNDGFGYMDLLPHDDAGGPTGRFYAQVMQLDPPEEITSRRFERDFLLGLQLPDPRIYFPELAVDVTGNPAAVDNTGTAPVDPVITVAGASGDVEITDGTHTLTFRNVPSGSLVIDFAARTAKVGATHCELVVADSDWWDSFVYGIEPGSHSIAQTGGTGVEVEFTPAVWA